MKEKSLEIGTVVLLATILSMFIYIDYKIDKLYTKIDKPIIIHQVDNAGGMMNGKVTDKEIINGRYTVTAGAYGKFLVTEEQYQKIKVGDDIPEFLKGRGR